MVSYGVGVSNIYDLLDEDGVVRAKAVQKVAPTESAVQPTAAAAAAETVKPVKHQRRHGASQGGRPPRREFDRHSGTGRSGHEMKRTGKGRYNWGDATEDGTTEVQTEEQSNRSHRRPRRPRRAPANKQQQQPGSSAPVETEEQVVVEPVPVEPEEEVVDSDAELREFDDYMKEMAANRVEEDDQIEIRRVQADDVDSVREINRNAPQPEVDADGDLVDGSITGEKIKAAKKKVKKETGKISLEEFHQKTAATRRTNSSRYQGGRYRNGDRNSRQQGRTSMVDLHDTQAFPSLEMRAQ